MTKTRGTYTVAPEGWDGKSVVMAKAGYMTPEAAMDAQRDRAVPGMDRELPRAGFRNEDAVKVAHLAARNNICSRWIFNR